MKCKNSQRGRIKLEHERIIFKGLKFYISIGKNIIIFLKLRLLFYFVLIFFVDKKNLRRYYLLFHIFSDLLETE